MPRSAKAASRTSIASKRTSKRNTSKQRAVYAIPESPQTSASNTSRCEADASLNDSQTSSPTPSNRNNSTADACVNLTNNQDATPKQSCRSRTASLEAKRFQLPGFEALDAVNGLYQKINDSKAEIERLDQEKQALLQDLRNRDKQIKCLQTSLQTESDKLKRLQQAQNAEDREGRRVYGEKLDAVLDCLRNFSSAAYNLMPLLDVLTDARDIEYDEATEHLYEVMKEHRERINCNIATSHTADPKK